MAFRSGATVRNAPAERWSRSGDGNAEVHGVITVVDGTLIADMWVRELLELADELDMVLLFRGLTSASWVCDVFLRLTRAMVVESRRVETAPGHTRWACRVPLMPSLSCLIAACSPLTRALSGALQL